jgi:hypothetical protein
MCIPLLLLDSVKIPILARQPLSKHITAATHTHAIQELLDMSFFMQSVLHPGKQVITSYIPQFIDKGNKNQFN